MDINYVFYKELPLFDENIFSANLAENKEIEEIRLNLDNQHLITSLKVNQKSEKIEISDELLSNSLIAIAQKAKNVSFRCNMEMENVFFSSCEFEKKDDVKKQTFKYNNKKGE